MRIALTMLAALSLMPTWTFASIFRVLIASVNLHIEYSWVIWRLDLISTGKKYTG